jgi:hypothetical protein
MKRDLFTICDLSMEQLSKENLTPSPIMVSTLYIYQTPFWNNIHSNHYGLLPADGALFQLRVSGVEVAYRPVLDFNHL